MTDDDIRQHLKMWQTTQVSMVQGARPEDQEPARNSFNTCQHHVRELLESLDHGTQDVLTGLLQNYSEYVQLVEGGCDAPTRQQLDHTKRILKEACDGIAGRKK